MLPEQERSDGTLTHCTHYQPPAAAIEALRLREKNNSPSMAKRTLQQLCRLAALHLHRTFCFRLFGTMVVDYCT